MCVACFRVALCGEQLPAIPSATGAAHPENWVIRHHHCTPNCRIGAKPNFFRSKIGSPENPSSCSACLMGNPRWVVYLEVVVTPALLYGASLMDMLAVLVRSNITHLHTE